MPLDLSAAGDTVRLIMDDLIPGCYNCDRQAVANLPPRDDIITTPHWRVAHAFNVTQPGWLVLAPTRHALSFTDLGEDPHDRRRVEVATGGRA